MKKFLLVLLMIGLIVGLFVGCDDVTPSEGEDEDEGEGESEPIDRVVMIELYMTVDCPSCIMVEPILEQLAAEEYDRSQMILVEEAAWGMYTTTEISNRYKWYFPNSADRSTPNILFNGLNQRIHGDSTYYEIKSKIIVELGKDAKIKITATRNSNSNTTTITGTIENISSVTLDNLIINGMTYKDRGETGFRYSVTDIFAEQEVEISTLAPGDTHSFSFTLEGFDWDGNYIDGVIFVQDEDSSTKEILQALYID